MIRTTEEFRMVIKAARRVGTPLVAVRTADPASAIAQVTASVNGKTDEAPLVAWDFIGGLQGRNEAGKSALAKLLGENSPTLGPSDVLALAGRIAADAIIFVLNPQRFWEQADVVQGIWNLRDMFKAGGQMLVLVTPPGATLPLELQNDVMLADEPLPSPDDLGQLVADTFESASLPAPDQRMVSQAVDALVGLAAFPAEQVLAMSLSKKGLNLDRLWERKRQAVEQTPGLTVWRGGETFDQIGGPACDGHGAAATCATVNSRGAGLRPGAAEWWGSGCRCRGWSVRSCGAGDFNLSNLRSEGRRRRDGDRRNWATPLGGTPGLR